MPWSLNKTKGHEPIGIFNSKLTVFLVRVLAFHQCFSGSYRYVKFLYVMSAMILFCAPTGYFPWCFGFPNTSKNQHLI